MLRSDKLPSGIEKGVADCDKETAWDLNFRIAGLIQFFSS